jgi:hypothetical protein
MVSITLDFFSYLESNYMQTKDEDYLARQISIFLLTSLAIYFEKPISSPNVNECIIIGVIPDILKMNTWFSSELI